MKYLIWLIFLLPSILLAQDSVLDEYVRQGLTENRTLKQQQIKLDKQLSVLRQAKGLFYPTIDVEARYSRAGGGRSFDFPAGDLFNPVYSTLNQMLLAQGQPAAFPENIDNQSFPLLREEEQDTKIRLIQPLFAPEIWYNKSIQTHLYKAETAALAAYQNELTFEIREAYFNWMAAGRQVELYEATLPLLDENIRVNETLVANDQATEEVVLRAKAERFSIEQTFIHSKKQHQLAGAWFNFLINRNQNAEIKIDQTIAFTNLPESYDEAEKSALLRRQEFMQLSEAQSAAGANISRLRTKFLPTVSLVLDAGVQGENYNLNSDSDYWMGSVVLKWNIFNGRRDREDQAQAELDRNNLILQNLEVENQIKLQVLDAWLSVEEAENALISVNAELESAGASFNIINKKYGQQLVNQITWIDAQTTVTQTAIKKIVAEINILKAKAKLEMVSGTVN